MKSRRLTQLLLVACVLMAVPTISFAAVIISVTVAPPPIPVYVQPPCPAPGYLWTPGYWAWGPEGYFWVPGAWVLAPSPGLLWTPGYWGWDNGFYIWHAGYWGPVVGFYGGINYGFGYFGFGFVGGEWRGDRFYYNRAFVRVDRRVIRHVYVNRSVRYRNRSRVSYNGGTGGIHRRAYAGELRAERHRRISPTRSQQQQRDWARRNPGSWARNNRGRPPVAATSRAGDFSSRSRVRARSAGGRVRPETLNATPRTMPPARQRRGTVSPRGGAPGTVTPQQRRRGNVPQTQPRRSRERAPAVQSPGSRRTRPTERTAPGWNRQQPSRPDTSRPRPEGRRYSQPESRRFSEPPSRSRPATRSAPARRQSERGQRSREQREEHKRQR